MVNQKNIQIFDINLNVFYFLIDLQEIFFVVEIHNSIFLSLIGGWIWILDVFLKNIRRCQLNYKTLESWLLNYFSWSDSQGFLGIIFLKCVNFYKYLTFFLGEINILLFVFTIWLLVKLNCTLNPWTSVLSLLRKIQFLKLHLSCSSVKTFVYWFFYHYTF